MSMFDNKPMTILVGVNIIALMVIFWLIGLLMGRDSTTPPPVPAAYIQQEQVLPQVPPDPALAPAGSRPVVQTPTISPPPRDNASLQQRAASIVGDLQMSEAHAATTQAEPPAEAEPVMVNRYTTIDVFYDGSIAQIEKTDDAGNRTISISNNLKEVQKLSEEDAAYLDDYRKMKSGQIGHMQITSITQEEARSIQVASAADITEEEIDHFNKVDVSKPAVRKFTSLASKVAMLVNAETATPRSRMQNKQQQTDSYLTSLESASAERRNETRTIKVNRGDSLWRIARRAYGNGFDYARIYAANPHIKNPDMIRVGEILRVPL